MNSKTLENLKSIATQYKELTDEDEQAKAESSGGVSIATDLSDPSKVTNSQAAGAKATASSLTSLAQKTTLFDFKNHATSESNIADLDIADENGNVLLRISEGHIKTKEFDSRNVHTLESVNELYKPALPSKSIFKCFHDVENKYVRIPCITASNYGTLIAVAETRTNGSDYGENDIIMTRSLNYGKSWSTPTRICTYDSAYTSIYTCPSLLTDKSTNRIYLFVNKLKDSPRWEDSNAIGYSWELMCSYSDDEGETWTVPSSINSDISNSSRFTTEIVCLLPGIGHGITMDDGTLVLNVQAKMPTTNTSDTGDSFNIQSAILYSKDNGETWTLSNLVPCYSSECQVMEYATGKLVINCRSYIGTRRVYYTEDLGTTWIEATADKTIIEPSACEASCISIQCNNEKRMFFLNPHDSTARRNYVLQTTETGISNDYTEVLKVAYKNNNQGGYTDLCAFKGKLFCVYEGNVDDTDGTIEFVDLTDLI